MYTCHSESYPTSFRFSFLFSLKLIHYLLKMYGNLPELSLKKVYIYKIGIRLKQHTWKWWFYWTREVLQINEKKLGLLRKNCSDSIMEFISITFFIKETKIFRVLLLNMLHRLNVFFWLSRCKAHWNTEMRLIRTYFIVIIIKSFFKLYFKHSGRLTTSVGFIFGHYFWPNLKWSQIFRLP